LGQGATFYFTVVGRIGGPSPTPQQPHNECLTMKAKTILLVEDNPDDADLTKRALAKNNIAHQLVVAGDGAEALDYLIGDGNTPLSELPAVVLLDINLPKINGLEVLRRLREHPRTKLLPVVILTTSREEHDLATAYNNHANSYIRKPVDYHKFVEAVGLLGLYWLGANEQPSLADGSRPEIG
jgi:two-component system response regulator